MMSTEDGHCKEMLEHFSAFLEDDLDDVCCDKLKEHLAQCPECVGSVDEMRRIGALCRSSIAASSIPPPTSEFSEKMRLKVLDQDDSGQET